MLIFDQLKKNDPQLRVLAVAVFCGLCVLAAGLWWVQIVSAREYQTTQETQSSRTVRVPAVRGKILDRNGMVLAENRPVYNLSLYFDDLQKTFNKASDSAVKRVRAALQARRDAFEKSLPPYFSFLGITWHRRLTKAQKIEYPVGVSGSQLEIIKRQARYQICSNLVASLQDVVKVPFAPLDPKSFEKHYAGPRALPFPVITNLTPAQVAIVAEKCSTWTGVDLDMASTRVYPHQNTASHILGYVKRTTDSMEGDPAYYNFRLEGFQGELGIEAGMDKELRGKAGSKVVLVNSAGYRQTENTDTPVEPGSNVVLTIDLELQQAAENALRTMTALPKKAAVVMDVRSGDILAMASMPSYNPNSFVQRLSSEEYKKLNDPEMMPQMNRATQGRYAPGSIFKTIVGMALLERGLDPARQFNVSPDPRRPGRGIIYVGGQGIQDQAPPGMYDFKKALVHSSNTYFITNGILMGIDYVVELGQRLHLGQPAGLPTRQENPGSFPTPDRVRSRWYQGNTANFCIGQDPVLVTPLQMAVVAAAIGNGGTVLYPRLVDHVFPSDPALPPDPVVFPKVRVRDHLRVSQRTMRIVHEAMLADVEDPQGTGRAARNADLRICAKTGTAQVKDTRGNLKTHNVWFMSFAPYPQPRYAVVVMIEGGSSGGGDCAPVAGEIYRAIAEWERKSTMPKPAVSQN